VTNSLERASYKNRGRQLFEFREKGLRDRCIVAGKVRTTTLKKKGFLWNWKGRKVFFGGIWGGRKEENEQANISRGDPFMFHSKNRNRREGEEPQRSGRNQKQE